MSFTGEEVRKAVDTFLNSPVKVPILATGSRDILLARDRAFALLTNALVGDPQAVYHLAWMASNRLYGLLRAQIDTLSSIEKAAVQSQTVRFRPLNRFDELTTAQGALLELDAAVSGSGVGASGPGVGQFQRSVRKFAARELRPLLPEIEYEGTESVPDTPLNLRRTVQRNWVRARELDQKINDLISNIGHMLNRLSQLRLPERSIQSLITGLRERTTEIQDELTSSEAESAARQAYLDLLVMDSILGRTSQFSVPPLILAEGATASQAAPDLGGSVESTVSGPYVIDVNDTLQLDIEGVAEYVALPVSTARDIRIAELTAPTPFATYKLGVRAQEVASAINTQSSATASVRRSTQEMTLYNVDEAVGEAPTNKLYVALFAVDDASVGAGQITVPDWVSVEDFNAADRVVVDHDSAAGPHMITSRDLGTRTYTLNPGPTQSGPGARYVALRNGEPGPATGDKIELVSPFNPSFGVVHYEVVGYADGVVTLDQALVRSFEDDAGTPPGDFNSVFSANIASVFTEYLDVRAPAGSSLSIPDNAVSQNLGLDSASIAAPAGPGTTTGVDIPADIAFLGAQVGDILELDGVEYLIELITQTTTGSAVTIDTPLEYTGATYGYRVLSARHRSYTQMVEAIQQYPEDITDQFDILVNQTLQGKAAGQLVSSLSALTAELSPILDSLDAYTSPGRSQTLDAAVSMMRELGMDRAVDMLLSLRIEELFSMDRDGVSYTTHLVRAAATATRVVSPVSKDQQLDEEILGVFSSDLGLSD